MKKPSILPVLGLLFIISIAYVPVVWAVPPLPSSLYGTVKVGGTNPPAGTWVSAWIGGVQYVQVQSASYGGSSVYRLNVPGDDPSTPVREGGRDGERISFKIGTQAVAETSIWRSGSNLQLNLTVVAPDKTPPVTTATITGTTTNCALESVLYTGAGALVRLTVNEPAVSRYRISNQISGPGVWQTYTGPFFVSAEGLNTIEYTSTDTAGNVAPISQLTAKVTNFPQTPLLDTFNRANGPLGTNWAGATSTASYRLANQQVAVVDGGALYWQSGGMLGPTQEVYVTLSNVNSRAAEQNLLLKVQGGNRLSWDKGAIKVRYNATQQVVRVETAQPGRPGWASYANHLATIRNGDQFGARAMHDGTVRIYRSCLLIGVTDTRTLDGTFFVKRSGSVGLWFLDAKGASFDNFGGGTVQSASSMLPAFEP